jgi:thiamine monophosphate synthase
VADILHPESPILPDELGPAILCSTEQEASAASQLFDAEQLALIVEQGGEILGRLEADGIDVGQARQRLDTLEAQRREAERARTVN